MFGEIFSWYDLAAANIELLKRANELDCVPMVDHHKAYAEPYKISCYLSLANTGGLIEDRIVHIPFFVKLGSRKGKKWSFNLYNNVIPFSAYKYSTSFIFCFKNTEPNFPAHN